MRHDPHLPVGAALTLLPSPSLPITSTLTFPCPGCTSLGKVGLPRSPCLLFSLHVSQVTLSVSRLPTLATDEYLHCAFADYDSLAHVEGSHVTCVTPPQDQLPLNPPGTGEGPLGQVARAGAGGEGPT